MSFNSIEEVFGFTEEECVKILNEKFNDEKEYDNISEMRNAIIILAYNNNLLNKEDDKFVSSFRYDYIMKKEPKNYKKFIKIRDEKREYTQTFTLTICDRGENHAGMQIIGEYAKKGFSYDDLKKTQVYFKENAIKTEMIKLHNLLSNDDIKEFGVEPEKAYLLILRNGLSLFCDPDDFYDEQDVLDKDRQAFMRGKVVNKHARANLCFWDKSQKADFANKKGTIVKWSKVPLLNNVRLSMKEIIGKNAELNVAEGNYYEKGNDSYINFHGDFERKSVLGLRVGMDKNLIYQWFYRNKIYGNKFETILSHGDIYMMSEKAVGTDWKRKIIPTLRHASGTEKWVKIKPNWVKKSDQDNDEDD